MSSKITLKTIRKYFKDEELTPRHNLHSFKYAINETNKEVETDSFDLFMLIVENRPIDGLYTHSYGFHTANGRHIINTFSNHYKSHQTN